jgi:hypothetical protein
MRHPRVPALALAAQIAVPLAVPFVAQLATPALAQPDDEVQFDLTGMRLYCQLFGDCFPDQARNSFNNPLPPGTPQHILPAGGYRYQLDGVLDTSGLINAIIPDGSTLRDMMEILQPGQSRMLTGYARNPSGGLPDQSNPVYLQTFTGEVVGLELSVTLEASVSNTGVGSFEIRDIDIPLGILFGEVKVTSGSCLIETWEPSPRQQTEWHFDGDLSSVPSSGPSQLRYLDDSAFGTILGGIGNEFTPDPTIPHDVTDAQSSFSTTTALGIPGPGGEEATVYVTSPARNLSDPNPDYYRAIGLALFPSLRPEFPGAFLGQWTMIFDVYIPSASWSTEWPLALVHGSHNNEGRADCLIRNPGNGNGAIGYAVEPGQYLQSGLIGPDRWMRIALVSNFMQTNQTAIYINGTLLGASSSDWHYNSVDPGDPLYGDGEPVLPAAWQAWGEFPSPWALSSGNYPGSQGPTPLASTFGLFCDLGDAEFGPGGRSEVAYLANLYFADDMLTPAEIAALGAVDAAGIVFTADPCPQDFNGDGQVNTQDFLAYLNAWVAGDPRADWNDDGTVNTQDFLAYLNSWVAGC